MISLVHFILYGLSGWCLEVIWTGLGSLLTGDARLTAQTYLWMFPIYGLAVFLEPVHDRIAGWPWLVRGLLWMTCFFGIEYLAGWVIRLAVGQSPWNYFQAPWHLHGLIRLDYAPVWFMAGFAFERFHAYLQQKGIS